MKRGWWILETTGIEVQDLNDTDREHIGAMINGGYTQGEIVQESDCNDPWEDDSAHPAEDWQQEVRENNTRLGYLEWVEHQKEAGE